MVQKLAWLSLAGALGTLARFGLAGAMQRVSESFPYGTLAVNALGCFLFGFVWTLAEERMILSGETRFIILTGFMGAFTTFSTFAFETGQMMRDAEWLMAGANIGAELVLGLVFLFVGIAIGRQF
jgi:CrcB protein